MEATDAAELIAEIKEERAENEATERFNNGAALYIAILAALLAIGALGGGNATDDMVENNIKASDTWAFYQAKNVRQTAYRLAVDELELQLASPSLPPAARPALEARIADYKKTIARYDDEPDAEAPDDPLRGEGKKQLSARARDHEARFEAAARRDNNFDLSEVFLQLAIVMGSVALLTTSKRILLVSAGLGFLGGILAANGFWLLFPLPF